MQRSFLLFFLRGVRVGASRDQCGDDFRVVRHGGEVQGRPLVFVARIGVGASRDECGNGLGVAVDDGEVQGRPLVVFVARIGVDARGNQRDDGLGVAVPGGAEQFLIWRGGILRERDQGRLQSRYHSQNARKPCRSSHQCK